MSLIVAARFTTFDEAESAARALFARGVAEADVSIFYVNPPGQNNRIATGGDEVADRGARSAHRSAWIGVAVGAVVGVAVGALVLMLTDVPWIAAAATGGVGAYCGALMGALSGMHDAEKSPRVGRDLGVRHAGVLLAVHVTRDAEGSNEAAIATTLQQHGGQDVEQALGRWHDGRWSDFDPARAPVLSDKVPPMTASTPGH
ncbi:hypothetical protein ACDA63_03095 [Uliginosibacterium sp. sgz301328]|uniref:hypothetical protein n=1 Tax=Uliginosibacterium sp. sgz301328 TaxID=3243764 RepID=UPI00359D7C4F